MDKKILLKKLLELLGEDNIPDSLTELRKLREKYLKNLDYSKLSDDVLNLDNQFLRSDLINRKLTNAEKLIPNDFIVSSSLKNKNKICLWKGDISSIYADVVVNKINRDSYINDLFMKGGIALLKKYNDLSNVCELDISDILITRAYNIPCDLIIHSIVSKVNDELTDDVVNIIKKSYINVLDCVNNNMMKTVVLPILGIINNKRNFTDIAKLSLNIIDDYLNGNSTIEKVIICVDNDDEFIKYKDIIDSL